MSFRSANCAQRAFSRRRKAFGALDLGTNNCRLMIAVPKRDRFSVVATFSRIVRLGDGLANTGRLSDEAMDRAIDALKRCAELAARWDLVGLRCVTTEACRRAENGAAFVERVRVETGLQLEVVDAQEEARLAVLGTSELIAPDASSAAVFDIGGGSTELSVVDVLKGPDAERDVRLRSSISMPFGVVNLTDRFDGGFSGDQFDEVRHHVAGLVAGEVEPKRFAAQGGHLIGTSGTATSLAAMAKNLRRYRRRDVDGMWLTAAQIDGLIGRLFELGLAGRRAQPCIGDGRADLIMPGCAILRGILDATHAKAVRVADRGLREGIISELMAVHAARRDPSAVPTPSTQLAE
ncbi:MAG: Ppx/GppA family phosphatase [Parvularculaceae bacterium]|nr:Ppx/GppA family phosphatase [Parvularculaceae bacterium]